MTKEITKAFILQQIQDKFKLREDIPERFLFGETVIPTYNVEQHLLSWEVKRVAISITSADSFVAFTVPDNERWTLRAYTIIYLAPGAHTGTGMHISARPPGVAWAIYLDMKKGQDVSYLVTLPAPVVLDPGNVLGYLIDTYTMTQSIFVYIDVQVEVIR